ncbi:MAG: hypothetical protein [Wendovervirus sonii]|uniref:Uncharacterized protein n=1 Tax=phage Lak_Megaphage_Sonny TaxID=3109229 RepID=A0ABZ0Z623_9CAUD|nr:MAG: hypothetical protein [phage Lak_Megaphage_Sonny]
MENFYSNIGKNTVDCKIKYYSREKVAGSFITAKKAFVNMLKEQGCNVHKVNGNYINIEKNGVHTIFYFAWHNGNNINYILNKYIKERVDYFAFCTPLMRNVYFISYDKISKYCRNMATSYVFAHNPIEKLLIPDKWVYSHISNKM